MDLLSSFIHSSHNVSVPQDILLAQLDDDQRLLTLQKQITLIEQYHDFFIQNNIAVILSLDETMARTILSSEFLLRKLRPLSGNDSNLLIVFYVQIMPDDFVMQLHRF